MEKYELEDQEWVPPSEAEMKIMQANRERSDKISQIMGRYLLSGYKMLDSVCKTCGTIMLQDRRKVLYCVACSEVDNEHTKDNPALNRDAAKRQLEEAEQKTATITTTQPTESRPVGDLQELQSVDDAAAPSNPDFATSTTTIYLKEKSDAKTDATWMAEPQDVLKRKIRTTAEILTDSKCVSDCIQYCTLIKACAEALLVLRSLE